MRKSREEASRTRERIVSVASELFRKNGIAATGLAEIMSMAGLTHGGFYKHFASKDELVREATRTAIDAMVTAVIAGEDAPIRYLSEHHLGNLEKGCPFAALGSELVRADAKTRESATEGFREYLKALASYYQSKGSAEPEQRACQAAATLIGAVTMARLSTDSELTKEILKNAISNISVI